jgi:hypothetical protein
MRALLTSDVGPEANCTKFKIVVTVWSLCMTAGVDHGHFVPCHSQFISYKLIIIFCCIINSTDV